jgi:hypothetical protein
MTDAPHLDDEQLSALLDGEGDPADGAHAEGCDRCGARLARLRAVAAAVAEPPPPPAAADRDRAIAAALRAREVVPLRARRSGPPAWLLAAAAVLVLALLAVPFLAGGDDGDDQVATSGGDAAEESGGEEAATLESGAAPVDGGDLGPIDAGTDLTALAAASQAERAAEAPSSADESSGAGEGAADADAFGAPACVDAVVADAPTLGALRYFARATFDGEPAQVLVFDGPEAGQVTVYVAALDDCFPLNVQSAPN